MFLFITLKASPLKFYLASLNTKDNITKKKDFRYCQSQERVFLSPKVTHILYRVVIVRETLIAYSHRSGGFNELELKLRLVSLMGHIFLELELSSLQQVRLPQE